MTALDSNQRLNDVIEVWRRNRCISSRVVVIYCRWVRRFITYCDENGMLLENELTHAGVVKFVKWHTRSREVNVGCALSSARSALHAWRDALEIGGKSLPPWQCKRNPLPQLSPLAA
jgi:hypothetical protein